MCGVTSFLIWEFRRRRAAPCPLRCHGRREHALNLAPQQQHSMKSFNHGDTGIPPCSTPLPYGCAALYTFSHLFQPQRGSATRRKPATSHPKRTRPCTRLDGVNTQGAHVFFTFLTRAQRTHVHTLTRWLRPSTAVDKTVFQCTKFWIEKEAPMWVVEVVPP